MKHYDDVIAELVEQDFKIAPVLFHWDTPLALFNEYGAWSDRQIVDDFFDYATFIIQRYDHLVDEWFVSVPFAEAYAAIGLLIIIRRSTNPSTATGSIRITPLAPTFHYTTTSLKVSRLASHAATTLCSHTLKSRSGTMRSSKANTASRSRTAATTSKPTAHPRQMQSQSKGTTTSSSGGSTTAP